MLTRGLETSSNTDPTALSRRELWSRIALVLLLLFVFLVGIRGLGAGFKGLGRDLLDDFFAATDNPFVGLVIGLLATTLMQSSSVTTSMVVALVAAPENPLPITNAIPMIMGANIGTTVTSTIVALGHMARRDEFERAFAAATVHDFFNFLAVAVLLPVEMATGFLASLSRALSGVVTFGGPGKLPNPLKVGTKVMVEPLEAAAHAMTGGHEKWGAAVLIGLSMGIILFALAAIVRTLRTLAATRMKTFVTKALDANPYFGILIGIIVTVMIQSSSITTSIMVPLAGAGLVTSAQVFPVTLGANVGTTFTALVASMAAPPETARLAVQIALVHLLFNVVGILLVYPLRATRRIPIALAEGLARFAARSRKGALALVVTVFYGLPALFIAVTRGF